MKKCWHVFELLAPPTGNQAVVPNEGMPKFHPNILCHHYLGYDADESTSQILHQSQFLCLHWHTFVENCIAAMSERTIGIQELLPLLGHIQVSIERELRMLISYSQLLSLCSLSHSFPMVVQLSA